MLAAGLTCTALNTDSQRLQNIYFFATQSAAERNASPPPQYEEALISRVLRRPGSVLAACCGGRGRGYLASARAELRGLVKPSGKRLWASEFGCGTSPLDDMGAAIALSAVILQARSDFRFSVSCGPASLAAAPARWTTWAPPSRCPPSSCRRGFG